MKYKKNFFVFLFLFFCILHLTTKWAFPEQSTKGIPVLIYHKITSDLSQELSQTVISLSKFQEQMKYLYDEGYTTLSMDELVDFMCGKITFEKAVVLTFDDGWLSVKDILPMLNQYHFKATFFVITGKGIGGEHLDWDDIIEISQNPNFQIGAHTMTHPSDGSNNLITWLRGTTPGKNINDVLFEIEKSKKILEERLHQEIKYLAWPAGWYNEELIQIAQKVGYKALLTVDHGLNIRRGNIFKIKRAFINGDCDMYVFKETLKNGKSYLCSSENNENTYPLKTSY